MSTRLAVVCLLLVTGSAAAADLNVLFLGDDGHHQPRVRFAQLQPVLAKRGVALEYTDDIADLNAGTLADYDALVLYANIDEIAPAPAKALLDYVAGGGGFIPLHCASYCFRNDERVVALMGGQFLRHGTGTFRTQITKAGHPVMKGYGGFESWDETYVHTKHEEENRTVLEVRVEGDHREPWTWVRTHGKGRVFYTAWGHDHRTWGNPGFQNLVERGIRWAAGDDPAAAGPYLADRAFPVPEMNPPRKDVKPFEYVDVGARIPNYTAGGKWGTQGEAKSAMQKPLPAEESLKHYVVPKGFELQLFAAEPDIGKPIAIHWDERGRLWIAETVDYPNELQPPGKGRDRIRVCEDTNGDGRADKFTVFAEQLSVPTSILCVTGGVIVHQAPDTLLLKDTDGDGRADERKVLFTGWSTGDTHAGPSNLRYGVDNWIYGMVGYAGFRGTIAGEQRSFRTGFYRFRYDAKSESVTAFEFLRNTDNNSWGVGLSEDGLVFGSTANRNPSVYLPIPNRYYESVRGWSSSVLKPAAPTHLFDPVTEKVRQVDHHGGYTAGAGHALYTARAWPKEYWNSTAFVCGPTGHLVGMFDLRRRGADVKSRYAFTLMGSDDEWAAPIVAEVGPDGQLWVVDWYNFIVQHNPTPHGFKTGRGNAYETDLRDKRHGRVYRLVYTEGDEAKSPNLAGASPGDLVAALSHPNMLWRLHAQRLLIERGEPGVETIGALLEFVRDERVDATGFTSHATHALWVLNGLGELEPDTAATADVAEFATRHPSAGVRRAAVQVLPGETAVATILDAKLLEDADAHVRLAALLSLADAPANDVAGPAIVRFLSDGSNTGDEWLVDGATSAAATHAGSFLAAAAGAKKADGAIVGVVERVAEHFARSEPGNAIGPVLVALEQAPRPVADATITGLARGWRSDAKVDLDEAAEGALVGLVARLSPGPRSQLVRLGDRLGSDALEKHAGEIAKGFLKVVEDEDAKDADRIEAAVQLVAFQPASDDVVEDLLDAIGPRTSPELTEGLIAALGASRAGELGEQLVDRIGEFTPAGRRAALRVLLGRRETAAVLVAALDDGDVPVADLSLDQKQSLLAHPDAKVAERAKTVFARGGGLPNPDRQRVIDELLHVTEEQGDVERGREVYKKQCMKCHVHGEIGTRIGPDLTGMAVHPKEELLVHILDPSRSVEGNFRVYTVVMDSGKVFNGLLASETRTTLELFDTEGKKHILLREEVEELIASKKSLMPEGFEKQLPGDDLSDLLSFLTKRGRYLPLPLAKAATAVSTRGMFVDADASHERLMFPDWKPKTFEGVPFQLVDPRGTRVPNVVLLHGPNGTFPPRMPKRVELPCNAPAKAIHLLSGISGWGHPFGNRGDVSMIVRLHYADETNEDHALRNGVHFADYIRRVDVPGSKFAFASGGQQIRYLAVFPKRPTETITRIELVKGPDNSAPVVMAVTVEPPSAPE